MSHLTVDSLKSGGRVHLFGAGGLGRELASGLLRNGVSPEQLKFVVDDPYFEEGYNWCGVGMCRFSPDLENLVVALGSAASRAQIAARMGGWSHCATLVLGKTGVNVELGQGVIVASRAHVTCDVQIGEGSLIQMESTVAHDCTLGSCVSINPGARVNGEVTIGDRTSVGSQASIKEKISICEDVTIGMGAVVLKDILEPGIYTGVPAIRKA